MTPAESEAAARALRWLGHSPAAIIAITGRNSADRESYQPARWREWADYHPAARATIRRLIGQAFARAEEEAARQPERIAYDRRTAARASNEPGWRYARPPSASPGW